MHDKGGQRQSALLRMMKGSNLVELGRITLDDKAGIVPARAQRSEGNETQQAERFYALP